jgi:hypothetical protein
MGNAFFKNGDSSKDELKQKNLNQIIDYIATYYILTMDFENLQKLNDVEYCNNLVILTSDIIERYFTALEITYLAQRIKNGVEVNELEKDNLIFFNKDDLNHMSIENDTVKKKRVCIGIAKFYIKISHVFAAIVMTINPVYLYKDENGNNIKASLYDKKSIPPKTDKIIYRLNICDDRLNSLKNKWDPKLKNAHPKMCDVNLNSERNTKSLIEEPGIPELMELYYDDQYDFKTGKFIGMSEKTKNKYMSDLKIFYKIFTNNEDMPENITSFKDIKLKEYHKHPKCNGENPAFNRNYENDGSSLFGEYAENIKQMVHDVNKNQESLMKILNNLFVYTINPNSKKKQIRVSPRLTEKLLDEIVLETRTVIIRLYLNCEKSYSKGLHIYEAIVEKRILETTESQLENLEKQKEILSTYSEEPEIAKEQEEPKPEILLQVQQPQLLVQNEITQQPPQTSQEEPKPEILLQVQQPQLLVQNEITQQLPQTSQEEPKPEILLQVQQPQLLVHNEITQPQTLQEEPKPEILLQVQQPQLLVQNEIKQPQTLIQDQKRTNII